MQPQSPKSTQLRNKEKTMANRVSKESKVIKEERVEKENKEEKARKMPLKIKSH